MRRFSHLFTLLLLIVGAVSAYAQTPTADPITVEEVPTGYYFIASTNETIDNVANPYIAANGGTMKLVAQSAVTTDVSTSQVGLWYIKKTGTEGSDNHSIYSIQSMEGNKYYWGVGGDCPLQTTIGIYRIGKDDSGYYFYGNGTQNNITNTNYVNATSATAFGRNSSGANNKWKLIPAGVKDITLNYTAGSNTFSVSKLVGTGKELSTTIDFYKDFVPATITPDDATSSYSVTCAYNFPFELGKFYKLNVRKGEGGDRNVFWNVEETNIRTRTAAANADAMGGYWRFEIVPNTRNQVKMYTNAKGLAKAVTFTNLNENNQRATLSDNGTIFAVNTITPNKNADAYTNAFRLTNPSNNSANLNDVESYLGVWTDGGSVVDCGSTFMVEAIDEQPTAITSISATDENGVTGSLSVSNYYVKANDLTNLEMPVSFSSNITGNSVQGSALNVTYQNNFGFAISSATGEKQWNFLRARRANDQSIKNCYLQVRSSDNKIVSRGTFDPTQIIQIRNYYKNDASKWAFVKEEGTLCKFKIYNKSTGDKVLYLSSNTENSTDAQMVDASTVTTGFTSFFVEPNTNFTDYAGFTIRAEENNYAIGDHNNGVLSLWKDNGAINDHGSVFRVPTLIEDAKSAATQAVLTDCIGGLTSSAVTELNATNSDADFFAKFDELEVANTLYTTPDANKLYYIHPSRISDNSFAAFINATADAEGNILLGSGNYPDERRLTFTQTETPSVYVRFVPQNNGAYYLIQDVNSSFYYGYFADRTDNPSENRLYLVQNSAHAGHYTIDNVFDGVLGHVGLKENIATDRVKQYLWCRGESGSQAESYPMEFHSAYAYNDEDGARGKEGGCAYQVKVVDNYTAKVSAAGFASLCLPFSVTLPENVKAYRATAIERNNENEMTLVEVGTTIPAGEPVILQGSEGSYTLTINADNGTKATDNILTGATVKRTGINEEYYALAKKTIDGTETTAFFRVETHNMPANKAYLLKKDIPAEAVNAAMFMFNFDGNGGEVTGINTATKAEAESNVYYDLNGRRVLYPSHGIYVKGNGQKVFIK